MKLAEIWIAQEDFDDPDPEAIVLGVSSFVSWALDDCGLEADDIPAVALHSYWADRYLGEVMNGGHMQFAHNTGISEEAMTNVAAGLAAIGELEALETFRAFRTLMADADFAREVLDEDDYRKQPAALKDLNAKCPDIFDVRPRHAAWLRLQTCLHVMRAAELQEKMMAFEQAR